MPEGSPYAIKQWPVWIAIFILWCLSKLPYSIQLKIGKYIGLLAYRFAEREKQITQINLSRAFPHLTQDEQKKLMRESFISMGIGTLETGFGWWASEKQLKKLSHIEGLEHIQDTLGKNKGALIFTPHFSSLHIVGRLVNLVHPFAGMFFPPKNPVFREISRRHMHEIYLQAIPRDDVRSLIKSLKKNIAVLYNPDTDAGPKSSIFVPFFNIPTATVTATARFAQISNCAIIPATYFRQPDGSGYTVKFYPALENYPTGDEYQDALIINQWLEKFILEHPDQYLWQYKRFKTRPPGEERFYPKR